MTKRDLLPQHFRILDLMQDLEKRGTDRNHPVFMISASLFEISLMATNFADVRIMPEEVALQVIKAIQDIAIKLLEDYKNAQDSTNPR